MKEIYRIFSWFSEGLQNKSWNINVVQIIVLKFWLPSPLKSQSRSECPSFSSEHLNVLCGCVSVSPRAFWLNGLNCTQSGRESPPCSFEGSQLNNRIVTQFKHLSFENLISFWNFDSKLIEFVLMLSEKQIGPLPQIGGFNHNAHSFIALTLVLVLFSDQFKFINQMMFDSGAGFERL